MSVWALLAEGGRGALACFMPAGPTVVGTLFKQGAHDRLEQLFGVVWTLVTDLSLCIYILLPSDKLLLFLQLLLVGFKLFNLLVALSLLILNENDQIESILQSGQ